MIERATLVAGLGLGDEGKGSVVDWLVRAQGADTVVRYNGGAQAAHHVVTADGREHCFAQFGAGTLVPGVRTFLSRFTIVDFLALGAEERALRGVGVHDAYQRLTVDPRCVLVTPFHRLLNHMRERARGTSRHGSCGMGIGEARLDSERSGMPVVTAGDTLDRARLRRRLKLLWLTKLDQAEQLVAAHVGAVADRDALSALLEDLGRADRVDGLTDAYHDRARASGLRLASEPAPCRVVVFEGALGVLLDRELGFFPHVTPSCTTFAHADSLLAELGAAQVSARVGVTRAYATRHGAGPLVTEDRALSAQRPDRHNGSHPWQGAFRLGWFDAVGCRHAVRAVGGIDRLVVTNLDRLAGLPRLRLCHAYEDADGALVRDMRAPSDGRTAWLARCRPRYRDLAAWSPLAGEEALPGSLREYLEALAAQCGHRVTDISTGPTALDKQSLTVGDMR